MELEERTGAWHAEKEREKEAELTNLRYEVASAKRQITALQNTLSSKNREAAALRDALIERDVLLKEAACCIGDALALCREQLAQMDRASRLYMSYEMEWQSISARLSKMKDRLPEIPAAQEPAAQADPFIQEFPDKYDTYIEQGGSNVSGGQKQRLCIARALLKKPKILILDDSTSAVDTKTDALIRKAFREEIPDTTKFIIAQRISSIEDADKVLVMDGGRISAMGTHGELLQSCEIYREIYESQTKGGSEDE